MGQESSVKASTLLKANSLSTAAIWCLRIVVVVQCIGVARWALTVGTPVMSTLFNEQAVGGFQWSEEAAIAVDRTAGVCMLLAAGFTMLRPCWWVLLPVALWQGVLATAIWYQGGEAFSQITHFAHATRIVAPLVLAIVAPWPRTFSFGRFTTPCAVTLLRWATAITFIAHGTEALGHNPHFVDLIFSTTVRWLHWTPNQQVVEMVLTMIGIADIVVAVLLITLRWRLVAGYMAFWGLITAFSRFTAFGPRALHEVLIRAANGGLPLVLYIYWSQPTLNKANEKKPPTHKDSTS